MTLPQAQGNRAAGGDAVRQFTVGPDDEGIRLDRWFKRNLPEVGFATVSRWARTGQLRVDGSRAKPEDRLSAGQVLRVPPGGLESKSGPKQRPELTEDQLAEADAMAIHRDRAAIVINKPPGLATQGGTGTKHHVDGLLDAYVTGKGPRPRLVHRLDKDTSGVLLVAATPGSAAFFSRRFSGRSARKIYWALIVGIPDIQDGLIDLPMSKQPGTGGEKMHIDEKGGQTARTRYRVLERAGNSTCWVELQPLTGRTHQLRVHMAAIGHPIVGDGKYGGKDAFLTGTISRKMHLHARRLIIEHPDGTPLDIEAPLPEHFADSMTQLGFDEANGEFVDDTPPPPTKSEQKQAGKQHAKQIRKDKRGERKRRGDGSKPARAAHNAPKTPKKNAKPRSRPKKSGPGGTNPRGGKGKGARS